MKITGTDGEFVGVFAENETMQVNANALLRLVNSFKSGQTHRVMEHWALRNHDDSEIAILADNIRIHAGMVDMVEMPSQYSDQLPPPFVVGSVLEKECGDLVDLTSGFFQVGKEMHFSRYAIVLGANADNQDIYVGIDVPNSGFKVWTMSPGELKNVRVHNKKSKNEVNTLLPYVKQLIEAPQETANVG